MKMIKEILEWHMQKYKTILTGGAAIGTISSIRVATKFKTKLQMFNFKIDDEYSSNMKQTHIYGFFGHILIKRTFHPHGKFYIYWETIRSCAATVYLIIFLGYDSVLMDYRTSNIYILLTIKILFIIDYYIRLHVQFYNSKGILVMDKLETAFHYMKTSFLVDAIPIIPLYELNLHTMRYKTIWALSYNLLFRIIIIVSILFRPLKGLIYIEKLQKGFLHHLAYSLKYVLLFFTSAVFTANYSLMSTCTFINGQYDCGGKENFVTTSLFSGTTDTNSLFLIFVYAVVERFTSSFVGVSMYPIFGNPYESIIIMVLLWGWKIFIIASITGIAIGGHALVIRYRNKITNFVSFVNKELVTEEKIKEFIEHFDYIWQKTDGADMDNMLDQFTPKFQIDIKTHLFMSTLRNVSFFENLQANSYMIFIKYLQINHFKKDAIIIRCNDVQQTLYFVSKGEVDVMIGDYRLITLKRGACFGSFAKKGPTRQTITVVAKYHVEVLAIDSNLFYILLDMYPSVRSKVNNLVAVSCEYINSLDIENTQKVVLKTDGLQARSPVASSLMSATKIRQRCAAYYRHFNKLIHPDNYWYRLFRYILLVHFSPLSIIMLLMLHFLNVRRIYIHIYCALSDAPYYIFTYINFHMYFIDPESGIEVVEPIVIIKRYAKSVTFWLDLLSLFPLDYIFLISGAEDSVICFATLNRLFRFFHLTEYYNACRQHLSLTLFLQWSYIFHLVSCELTVMALVWFKIACPNDSCTLRESTGPVTKYSNYADKGHSVVLAFFYTVNLFTSTGISTVTPDTLTELAISILISLVSVLTLALLCSAFTGLLLINSVTRNTYQVNSHKMKTYVEGRGLSPVLVKKINDYMLGLWHTRRGELLPTAITEAPSYLRQDLMGSMYGHHIRNHFLFSSTHTDFIRQLNVHLQACMYMVGQAIVDRGDVDGCMYFVHRGEVKEIDVSGVETIKGPGTSFGEKQGLYKLPHTESYEAHTLVDVLSLRKNDWAYLLHWFPASREIIYNILNMSSSRSSSTSLYQFNLSDNDI